MLEQAIEKLQAEIKKEEKNPYVKLVGEYLIKHLEANPSDAEKILDKEKTIKNSLDEMRKAAEKKKVGNMAVLTDEEGFAVVFKYFCIDTKIDKNVTNGAHPVPKTDKNVTKSIAFDVDLDDLLGRL